MDLLDAHVHLLGKKIFRNIDELRLNWLNNNIKQILHVSSTLHESRNSFESFKGYPEVLISVGKHPWKIKQANEEEQKEFEKLIARKECTAIGEVGLDYYAIKDTNRYEYQKEWFKFFIEMSNKYKKPLNMHVTGAEQDIYDLLVKYCDKTSAVNIHWYSGPIDTLEELIDLGCYFSINPAIYYSEGHQKALSIIPIEQILTESDGDVFYKRLNLLGEPSIVTKVVDKICEFKNYDKSELTAIISKNFYKYLHN